MGYYYDDDYQDSITITETTNRYGNIYWTIEGDTLRISPVPDTDGERQRSVNIRGRRVIERAGRTFAELDRGYDNDNHSSQMIESHFRPTGYIEDHCSSIGFTPGALAEECELEYDQRQDRHQTSIYDDPDCFEKYYKTKHRRSFFDIIFGRY